MSGRYESLDHYWARSPYKDRIGSSVRNGDRASRFKLNHFRPAATGTPNSFDRLPRNGGGGGGVRFNDFDCDDLRRQPAAADDVL